MARHENVHPAIVTRVAVRHRTDQTVAIRQASKAREVLADTNTRLACCDWVEWSAEFQWSVRLHVETIDLTTAVVLHDDDTRPLRSIPTAFVGAQELRQSETESPNATELY
jgi:hypothetical protein